MLPGLRQTKPDALLRALTTTCKLLCVCNNVFQCRIIIIVIQYPLSVNGVARDYADEFPRLHITILDLVSLKQLNS